MELGHIHPKQVSTEVGILEEARDIGMGQENYVGTKLHPLSDGGAA